MKDGNKRVVPPVGHIITGLRKDKGWSIADLAGAAGLDEKTVRQAENSESKYPATLRRIADALDSDVATLRGAQQNEGNKRSITVTVRFEIHQPALDDETAQMLAKALQEAARAFSTIVPVSITRGSVLLTCEVSPTDVLRLAAALEEGLLDEPYQVSEITLPSAVPLLGAVAMQRLTSREERVLRLLVEGRTPREIAKELNLSPKTVQVMKYSIMRKFEVNSLGELVSFAKSIG